MSPPTETLCTNTTYHVQPFARGVLVDGISVAFSQIGDIMKDQSNRTSGPSPGSGPLSGPSRDYDWTTAENELTERAWEELEKRNISQAFRSNVESVTLETTCDTKSRLLGVKCTIAWKERNTIPASGRFYTPKDTIFLVGYVSSEQASEPEETDVSAMTGGQ